MLYYDDVSISHLLSTNQVDINDYITVGLLLNPHDWGVKSISEWSYGKAMEFMMMFSGEITINDMAAIASFASGLTEKQVHKKKWYEVFAFYNYLLSEVTKIDSYLRTLYVAPTGDEITAGIENYSEFGVFATIDRLAGGDLLKYAAIEALPFMLVFTKLKLNKVDAEYQTALQNIQYQKMRQRQ